VGLILDSSVVIAAERQGHTAYQMLEAIGAQAADPEIAVSVVTVLELARTALHGRKPEHSAPPERSFSTIC
jgi:predicted nucleic acid-binding protein